MQRLVAAQPARSGHPATSLEQSSHRPSLITAQFAGAIACISLILLLRLGIFDPQGAAKLLGEFIRGYTGFWIGCKLVMAVILYVLILLGATEVKTARLDV